jgi:hypothetical protein
MYVKAGRVTFDSVQKFEFRVHVAVRTVEVPLISAPLRTRPSD